MVFIENVDMKIMQVGGKIKVIFKRYGQFYLTL